MHFVPYVLEANFCITDSHHYRLYERQFISSPPTDFITDFCLPWGGGGGGGGGKVELYAA